ncbi:hypothetical protein HZR84_06325 [Hyphobacterium sp. CCMP332]|nr:hypothetical protein HZR84_06325 [Hyphobacterium sp. CCMP332]
MKYILIPFLALFIFFIPQKNYGQERVQEVLNSKVSPEELNIIIGQWTGTLTYIDYKSNNPYTMPADLIVEKGSNENQLVLSNIYPKEPKANDKYNMKLSKNGTQINKKTIKTKKKLANNQTEIAVEYTGKDDNKKALIRTVYTFDSSNFSIRKEVNFDSSDKWIKRNEYKYLRKE